VTSPTSIPRALGLVAIGAVASLLTGCSDGEQAINDPLPTETTLDPSFPLDHNSFDPVSTGAGEACDSVGVHSQMAMWNATLADEMVELECPWPWAPELQGLDGGTEDPSIDAPFEPHLYADVFAAIDAERFGTCEVRSVPQDESVGLVFGFDIGLHAETCADVTPNVTVSLDEFATRAFRDEAANATPDALVLGRWLIQVTGSDADAIGRLTGVLEDQGAVTV
jgi:hypothetical protein